MKNLISIIIIALTTTIAFVSCKKQASPTPAPSKNTSSASSKTVIANTAIVGDWSLVTDTISFNGTSMYYGKPTDHYIFTKYANMYVNSGPDQFIDTAVYRITAANVLYWQNSYVSILGQGIYATSFSGNYAISSVTDHSLILTQNSSTPDGWRYEVITFKK